MSPALIEIARRRRLENASFHVADLGEPLTDMFAAFADAGFSVVSLREPMPMEACRIRDPEAWRSLTTRPAFVFFDLRVAR